MMPTPTKAQLVGMVANLRGELYAWLYHPEDMDRDQIIRLVGDTKFEPDDSDLVPHSDGGRTFDRTWDSHAK